MRSIDLPGVLDHLRTTLGDTVFDHTVGTGEAMEPAEVSATPATGSAKPEPTSKARSDPTATRRKQATSVTTNVA